MRVGPRIATLVFGEVAKRPRTSAPTVVSKRTLRAASLYWSSGIQLSNRSVNVDEIGACGVDNKAEHSVNGINGNEVQQRLATYHEPYHLELARILSQAKQQHGARLPAELPLHVRGRRANARRSRQTTR